MTEQVVDHKILGFKAEDLVTGLKGTITAVCESRNGQIQYLIEPKRRMLEREAATAWLTDYQQIELGKIVKGLKPIYTTPVFKLGERVKGMLVEVEGVVTARTRYLNGCIAYQIMPDGKHQSSDAIRIFEPVLTSAQEGATSDHRVDWDAFATPVVTETSKTQSKSSTRPNGPSRRFERNSEVM